MEPTLCRDDVDGGVHELDHHVACGPCSVGETTKAHALVIVVVHEIEHDAEDVLAIDAGLGPHDEAELDKDVEDATLLDESLGREDDLAFVALNVDLEKVDDLVGVEEQIVETHARYHDIWQHLRKDRLADLLLGLCGSWPCAPAARARGDRALERRIVAGKRVDDLVSVSETVCERGHCDPLIAMRLGLDRDDVVAERCRKESVESRVGANIEDDRLVGLRVFVS